MAATVQDELEITRLLARYNRYFDRGRVHDAAELFVADGVLDGVEGVQSGKAAISSYMASFWTNEAWSAAHGGQHIMSNVDIEFTSGDSAEVFSSLAFVAPAGQGWTILFAGSNSDQVVRTPEGWRFAVRRIRVGPVENEGEQA
ncbi:nuclear transport factor 2 family protein [Amycolatopsis bartoniae]|uniref:SnoaL-like domain-containing protein n=1 Tax=Amycolatopsis bartoniae TaxID=941986 RepID=A0A8H9IPP6_9PSEU|nr:nuclear transport factor 2 family protein [Amycolatopsis bartoniae]GHF35592.1 hypothetical protein GCM10017566_05580 [Amycolatopsis bartoniae]